MEEVDEMVVPKDVQEEEVGGEIESVKVTKLGSPTREEMRRMLEQCEENPGLNVWNWKVAEILRYCLDLDEELTRVHQAVRDYDHGELEKKIAERLGTMAKK